MVSHVTKVLDTKKTDIFNKIQHSRIISYKGSPFKKKSFTRKLARRLAFFVQDQEPSSVTGCSIPFLKVLVQSTSPNRWLFHKTVEMLDKGAIEKVIFQISSWTLLLSIKDRSSCPYINLQALNNFIYVFSFPLFSLTSHIPRMIIMEKVNHLIILTTTWQTQSSYAQLPEMLEQPVFLLLGLNKLLTNPQGKNHSLAQAKLLGLLVWEVYRKVCQHKEFQAMLSSLSHIQEEIAQQLITN